MSQKEQLNKLKTMSVADLEVLIGQAVSEAIKEECECGIHEISYEVTTGATFKVHITTTALWNSVGKTATSTPD